MKKIGQAVKHKFVSGVEGLRFKSQANQIGHNVANVLPLLQYF